MAETDKQEELPVEKRGKVCMVINGKPIYWVQDHSPLNKSEVQAVYDDYADIWEEYVSRSQHQGATIITNYMSQFMKDTDRSISILDVGCGTGFIGCQLQQAGFTNIDGLDASSKMIEFARTKNAYKKLLHKFVIDCTSNIIPDDSYDLIVGVGVIGPNYLKPEDFDVLWRIQAKEGFLLLSATESSWQAGIKDSGVKEKLDAMVADGKYELIANDIVERYIKLDDDWKPSRTLMYKKL